MGEKIFSSSAVRDVVPIPTDEMARIRLFWVDFFFFFFLRTINIISYSFFDKIVANGVERVDLKPVIAACLK